MLEQIDIRPRLTLDDYAAFASLDAHVEALRRAARDVVPRLRGRTVWMLSSTATGGGVAEMMPRVVEMLRELGVRTEWLVLRPTDAAFFAFTKKLHNLAHGHGTAGIGSDERALYDRVSREAADAGAARIAAGDVIVAHDPQPLGAGSLLARSRGVPLVWRCHVGTDEHNAATDAAWEFLRPYASTASRVLFSTKQYIRDFLAERASVMHPTIDPLTHKNRELPPTKLVGILANAALASPPLPILTPAFAHPALRLGGDGGFVPATVDEIGLPWLPIIAQVSRWDRLKGFDTVLRAFARMKRLPPVGDPRQQRRRQIVRLVLAGPAPEGVSDDPEAEGTIAAIADEYRRLEPALQKDIAILSLPMKSTKQNALMVNCLQRSATIVVQDSIAEAFGLTATEAMWKAVPVLVSGARGLREQVRDRLDGRINEDARDVDGLARLMDEMLAAGKQRQAWGRSGQKRVWDEFLIFHQLRDWLAVLSGVADASR